MEREKIFDWLNEWADQISTEAMMDLLERMKEKPKEIYSVNNSFNWNSSHTYANQ